jgi:cysteinyl-tRNA synthetase
MERELGEDAAVLGVDEHTAVLIDLRTGDIEIRGRGGLTVRRSGESLVLPAGIRLTLAELRDLVQGIRRAALGAPAGAAAGATREPGGPGGEERPAVPLPEIMAAAERRFEAAAAARDSAAMAGVILELEAAIGQWEADTDEDQGTDQARALLRSLVGRLGRAAQDGLADPRDRLRPAVEPLLRLRAVLREQDNFAVADAIRQALTAAGLDVSDTPEGTRWEPTGKISPASG